MFEEDWIEDKLYKRLKQYQKKHPGFNIERFMEIVARWDHKLQRWSPYMKDKDIVRVNKQRRFWEGMGRIQD